MFIDIAFNPSSFSESELNSILERSKKNSVLPILVNTEENTVDFILSVSSKYKLPYFIGVHPLHVKNVENLDFLDKINEKDIYFIGLGECGLDYYRDNNKEQQKNIFLAHFDKNFNLPFFLHCRNSFSDFYEILKTKNIKGVVHSFDGTIEEALKLIELGFYIGINGCSMKNSIEMVKKLPLDRILLETDSPYCLIRKSYKCSSYVNLIKSKNNEPSFIKNIAEAIANIKGIEIEEVEKVTYKNTLEAFPKLKEIFNKLK